jgi:SAM-dependent methyltransferase
LGCFEYYDLLYKDKDYPSECDLIEKIFQDFSSTPIKKVLDLGCGTGKHSLILSSRGYSVTGVDKSRNMLRHAEDKNNSDKSNFIHGDVRDLVLGIKYDAVISMFPVMSYMITNSDSLKVLHVVRSNLKSGGVFVFDSWFGPDVFHDPPTVRQRELFYKGIRVIRTASPTFDPVEQIVDVRFDVMEMLGDEKVAELTEHHLMRPFFVQEVKHFAGLNDMELLTVFPWMDINGKLSLNDWLAGFVLRAKQDRYDTV